MEDTDIKKLIEEFIENNVKKELKKSDIDEKLIYNEMSLQHELGIFLRSKLDKNYIVQFERNLKEIIEKEDKENKNGGSEYLRENYKKKEIDILITNIKSRNRYAVELKYHKKNYGEIPDVMYNCIKDMFFTQRLSELDNFKQTFCVNVVEDETFYNGKKIEGIYTFFRQEAKGKQKAKKKIEEYAKLQRTKESGEKISVKDFKEKLPIKWVKFKEKELEEPRYYIIEFKKNIKNK